MDHAPQPGGVLRGMTLPLHHQVRLQLRQLIDSGEWPEGHRLPGERELMQRFAVSRTTIRQALDALERDGLIVRRHGSGTFVAHRPVVVSLAQLQGFTEELRARGMAVQVRVVQAGIVRAPDDAAQALGLEAGAAVAEIGRVILLDGQPLFTDESYLPPVPGRMVLAAEPGQPIYTALEAVGFPVARGEQTIEAARADRSQARHLGIRTGEPVLLIRRVARLVDGTPVEFRRAAYRGDRYRYRIALIRAAPGAATLSPAGSGGAPPS